MIGHVATGELPGTTLDDRYEIGGVIGQGGMAVVFRAWDTELHRDVAIKVLRSEPDGPDGSGRRVREARALASINHPSLVTLFDAIIRDDRSYLVMELVEGDTLRDRIKAGPVPPRDVAIIAGDLAEALHSVHAKGIIHRDIKPANILLAPSALSDRPFRTKLSDFGIAHFSDATRVTAPGLLIGTALYISPEQASGAPLAPPSDIYALGLTLLEALTGEAAFSGTPLEVVAARMSRDPEVPERLGADWAVLLRAMTSRDPATRPVAADVAASVRRIAADTTGAGLPRDLAQPTAVMPIAETDVLERSVHSDSGDRAQGTSAGTRLLPSASATPTEMDSSTPATPAEATAATAVLAPAPRAGTPRPAPSSATAERRAPLGSRARVAVATGVAAVLIVTVGGVIAANLAAPAPTTTPAPALPSLPTPLDTDMQTLLDQVQP